VVEYNGQQGQTQRAAAVAAKILATARQGPLQKLCHCAPAVLDIPDPMTGLYPFMLAASIDLSEPAHDPMMVFNVTDLPTSLQDDPEKDEDEEEEDIYQLDTIFNLLVLYPQSLQCGFK
jgi:hypothetical protein